MLSPDCEDLLPFHVQDVSDRLKHNELCPDPYMTLVGHRDPHGMPTRPRNIIHVSDRLKHSELCPDPYMTLVGHHDPHGMPTPPRNYHTAPTLH